MYLIAHKVRGEPAFDVAIQMGCPICEPMRQGLDEGPLGCNECDGEGYWWIIPTSGHRAYPYWHYGPFGPEPTAEGPYLSIDLCVPFPPMPDPWPDHYASEAEPAKRVDVIKLLGLRKTIERRI